MRDLAILTFTTLDGVMQGVSSPEEDSSGGFTQGGWAMPYWTNVMVQVQKEAMDEPYDIVFGRKTYEMFASHRPSGNDRSPVDKMMDGATKHVVSNNLTAPSWQNTSVIAGDVVDEINRLKKQDGPLIQIHGSWQLIQTLLAHDLIDEFRLWVFPVVLGRGKRLFERDSRVATLHLQKSKPTGNGVVMNIYQRN